MMKIKNHFCSLITKFTANNAEGGAPVAILEAQATGLSVISSYHADIPEVVVDGKSALLAPERDVETLAKHIEYLVGHPDVWVMMGRAGREHVGQEYDVITQVGKLEEIYGALMKTKTENRNFIDN